MNPEEIPLAATRTSMTCARCGSGSSNAFGFEGLCLRCAGMRVLEMESGSPWEAPVDERPLERIGPYEVIEELGHGGMGRVFAARQPGMGRIVAVKAIREGLSPDLDLRFLREIQTVAALRHPNVVAVHDSGRSNGSVYFSMDYIEGGDLAARLRVEALSPREAAHLMSKVAEGLSYSHEKGILHRDLKPSNILLDGKEPKIADFGLASQIGPGGDLTAITHVLGTPHYLAPEAIAGGSAAQTVASDLYSAGVILFEMLTGRTPFAGASSAELPRLVKEAQAPSVRLLAPAVPTDLETICLKCLEREPSRRYASAWELADDLRRFLAGEPITARPASAWYRLLQFERRHRVAVISSGLVAAALLGATILSLWFAARATKAERKASAESAASRAVADFLKHDLLEQAAPDEEPDRDIKLRTVVDRAAAKVAERFKDQPESELGIRESLALTYESLADYPAEKEQIERAVTLARATYGSDAIETINDEGQYALFLARTGQFQQARDLLTQVIRKETKALGADARLTLHSTNDLIFIEHQMGKIQDAEALALQMVERSERALGPDDRETLVAESDLSSMYFWEGRYKEAAPLNEKAMKAYAKTLGPENPMTLTSMGNLAAIYVYEDRMDEARQMDEKLYAARKKLLGPEHPDTLRTLNNLDAAYRQTGMLKKAIESGTLSTNGRLKVLGEAHPDTIMSQANLAWALLESGQGKKAEELAARGLAAAQKSLNPDHFAYLGICSVLSEIYRRDGRVAEAEKLRRAVYASRLAHGGAENYNTLNSANSLAVTEVELGEYSDAETLLRPALVAWKKTHPDDWRALVCQNLMGAALAGEKRFAEAEPLLVSSADSLQKGARDIPVIDHRSIWEADQRVADAYTAWGRTDQATAWAKRAADAEKAALSEVDAPDLGQRNNLGSKG